MRAIDADLLGLTDFEIFMCNGDYKEALKMLIDKIENAPPIESQPRKIGKWIKRKNGALGFNCSCCGKSDISDHFAYCPNCGAEMRG